jgi:hypothetical protein
LGGDERNLTIKSACSILKVGLQPLHGAGHAPRGLPAAVRQERGVDTVSLFHGAP